jgi:hypothetical protein
LIFRAVLPVSSPRSSAPLPVEATLGRRFEYRAAEFPGWLTGTPSDDPTAEFWMRFADGRDADTLMLPFIVNAAPPVVLALGGSSTTNELTVHVRARPALAGSPSASSPAT